MVLNLAEGAGRRLPNDKARFYDLAYASLGECGAALDEIDDERLALRTWR